MATYVIAPDAALALLGDGAKPAGGHRLMAPAVLRSHLLERLYDAVRRGELTAKEATAQVDGLGRLGMRLLGDRVLQRTALSLAQELELPRWGYVEYVALAKLHGDALVTREPELLGQDVVPTTWVDALR